MDTHKSNHHNHKYKYTLRKTGQKYTKDYRVYFERHIISSSNGASGDSEGSSWSSDEIIPVSPFHDIPLYHDEERGVLNMVVEVPRWSNAKFEISRSKSLNPIMQDTLDDEPRFVKSCFPYNGYIWNYGALPQTWEDPQKTNPSTHAKGDNDPLDLVDISQSTSHSISPSGTETRTKTKTGTIKPVIPLGILPLIDSHETDWKVIVIDVNDPLATKLHDIDDVETYLPGLLDATRDWFRIYKIPDGSPANEYAFGGEFRGRGYAEKIIKECSDSWKRLIMGEAKHDGISLDNTTLEGTPGKLDPRDIHLPPAQDMPPAPIKPDLSEWAFIDRKKLDSDITSIERSKLNISLEIK